MILPKPVHLEPQPGAFQLTSATTFFADEASTRAAEALRGGVEPATGYRLAATPTQSAADITLRVDTRVGSDESYELTVTSDGIEIVGGGPAGVFYGAQSLRQLLPAESYSSAPVDADLSGMGERSRPSHGLETWTVPAMRVEDRPRFGWRGVMLDVGRHFMPKEFVLKFIDLLAMHKLNVLHLHLTDDQGWRVQIDGYPGLTEIGAWRDETLVGHAGRPEAEHVYDGKRHGGFYTKDDIREMVSYAEERFITVVPEIDMPGHMLAALAAYPELGNDTGPYEVGKKWGIAEQVINVDDATLDFCRTVLTEIMELFPSLYIHGGGDECPKTEWKASPSAQSRIASLGLADENSLQQWFTAQMAEFVTASGRRFVGWDEVLEGGGPESLPDDVVVMSWRSEAGGIEAARGGLDVVMSPTDYAYFDYYQADPAEEPLAIGGLLPLKQVYDYQVIPPTLGDEATHVLGTQANVWTEYIPTLSHVEYMVLPRLCAFAEAAWRLEQTDSFETFVAERLRPQLTRFDQLGLTYRPL